MAGSIYQSLYDFSAENELDLPLSRNDVIFVTGTVNSDWLEGVVKDRQGQFPISYTRKIFDNAPSRIGIAVGNFVAQEFEDLSLTEGDVVGILSDVDEWWRHGFTTEGTGIFPSNFVQELSFDYPGALSGKRNGSKNCDVVPWAEAIDDFQAQDRDELTLSRGMGIELIRELDSFWIEGVAKGKKGKFPKMFIKVVNPLPEELMYKEDPGASNLENAAVPKAKALYMFVGAKAGELSFDKGEIIILKKRVNKDWMLGQIGNHIGMFPSNHVSVLVDLPYEPDSQSSVQNGGAETKSSSFYVEKPYPPSIPISGSSSRHAPPPPKARSVGKPVKRSLSQKLLQSNNVQAEVTSRNTTVLISRPALAKENAAGKSLKPLGYAQSATQSRALPASKSSSSIQRAPVDYSNKVKSPERKGKPRSNSDHVFEFTADKLSLASPVAKCTDAASDSEKNVLSDPAAHPSFLPSSSNRERRSAPQPPAQKAVEAASLSAPVAVSEAGRSNQQMSLEASKEVAMTARPMQPTPPVEAFAGGGSVSNSKVRLPKPLAPTHASQAAAPERKPETKVAKIEPAGIHLTSDDLDSLESLSTSNAAPGKPSNALPSRAGKKSSQSVLFSKQTMPRSETDPHIQVTAGSLLGVEQPARLPSTPDADRRRLAQPDRPKSLYFMSMRNPATDKTDKRNLDDLLNRNGSLKSSGKSSFFIDSAPASTDSPGSENLEKIDSRIVDLKSKIESEIHMLSGVETLMEIVSEDKKGELQRKQEAHNVAIAELNEELNALEDEKSFLLASFGKIDDVKNRMQELEKQIEMYLGNCDKLRRMQDVAVIEELPEIRDNIEFCENMVDTLQHELNGLRGKIDDFAKPPLEDPEEQRRKREKNRERIVEELIKTEEVYERDMTVLSETVMKSFVDLDAGDIDYKILFGNLPEIVVITKKLHKLLKSAAEESSASEVPAKIADAFLDLASEMKDCYATYCRNYDDALALLEKYEQETISWEVISAVVRSTRNETGCWDLPSYLIKPVQRILKYPLLLAELLKNTALNDPWRGQLTSALNTTTDVATAINEFKRRKDLVLKYRQTDDSFGNKVQKISWHSVQKKSSRINQRLTQFTGLVAQTVDEEFNEQERRFRGLEKLIKSLVKNMTQFTESLQGNFALQLQLGQTVEHFYTGESLPKEELTKYREASHNIAVDIAGELISFVRNHVSSPMEQLLQLFQGPFRLIQKRNDKCLDYDRCVAKSNRAKDSRDREKISQIQEELQLAKNNFEALNSQLLEELPSLTDKCLAFVRFCLTSFVDAYRSFLKKAFTCTDRLWQGSLIMNEENILDLHEESVQKIMDYLSTLVFVPVPTASIGKDASRRKTLTLPVQPTANKTNFYVEVEETPSDPTSAIRPSNHGLNDSVPTSPVRESASGHTKLYRNASLHGKAKESADQNNADAWEVHTYVVSFAFEAEDRAELSAEEGTVVKVLRKCDKNGNEDWWLVEHEGKKGYIPQSYLVPVNDQLSRGHRKSISRTTSDSYLPPLGLMDSKGDGPRIPACDKSANQRDALPSHRMTAPDGGGTGMQAFKPALGSSLSQSDCLLDSRKNSSDRPPSLRQSASEDSFGVLEFYALEYDFEALNAGELSLAEGQIVKVIRKYDLKGNPEWWMVEHDGKQGYVPQNYLKFVDQFPYL